MRFRVSFTFVSQLTGEGVGTRIGKVYGFVLVVLSLTLASWSSLGATKERTYSSEKPLYAFVAVDENAKKILSLVFDESEGSGKGYDRIYADLNFNDHLTDDEGIEGALSKQGTTVQCSFPAIDVAVPYNARGVGVERPCQITVRYFQFSREGVADRRFSLEAKLRLKDEQGVWEYSLQAPLYTADKAKGTLVTVFAGKPLLIVQARPDGEKEKHVRIAAFLVGEVGPVTCSRGGKSAVAQVRLRDGEGKTIYSEDVNCDRLVSERGVESAAYSLPAPPGKHRLEVTVDTGPLAGVVKSTKKLVIN